MGPVELVTVDSGLASVVQSHSVDHSTAESQTVIEIHPGPEMDSDPDGVAEVDCDDKTPETDNETQIQAIEIVAHEDQQDEENWKKKNKHLSYKSNCLAVSECTVTKT